MLSDQLKAIRKANGFTQVELAKVIGVERSTYASYETGRNRPDIETVGRIAAACGVTVDFLMNLDPLVPVRLSDVVKKYVDEPRQMGELTPEEREIVAKLRIHPDCVEKIQSVLSQADDE